MKDQVKIIKWEICVESLVFVVFQVLKAHFQVLLTKSAGAFHEKRKMSFRVITKYRSFDQWGIASCLTTVQLKQLVIARLSEGNHCEWEPPAAAWRLSDSSKIWIQKYTLWWIAVWFLQDSFVPMKGYPREPKIWAKWGPDGIPFYLYDIIMTSFNGDTEGTDNSVILWINHLIYFK